MSQNKKNIFQNSGLILAGIFYLISIIFVFYNSSAPDIIDPSVKRITLAHWNLEDGVREGFDEAIRRFEALKASQGEKVKVVQTTIPFRGYQQWFLTQLIGGEPADVLKYVGGSEILNQYFIPLSEYINRPNPFNKGTVMEGVPWKDTFIDGMSNAMDPVYSEYYGVGTYFHTYRVFVNMDLLEKATGSRKLPRDLSEWMNICKKLKEYGLKTHQPIIPIGVRGFDKQTLGRLFSYYLSQLCGNFNDEYSKYCLPKASAADILTALTKAPASRKRLLAAVDIIREIGQYFGKGFTATDLEQTKFLFFSGLVGFFPEGTWNGYSMVKNSPFEVGVIPLPVIGKKHKYSKYFTGAISEQGINVGGAFGIPKATKHFDLALEFLQFITSYETNQMIMNRCKWPPAVKQARYEGLMKKFKPVLSGNNIEVNIPFYVNRKSRLKMLESLENIIKDNSGKAPDEFWNGFVKRTALLDDELKESLIVKQRNLLEQEMHRTSNAVILLDPGTGKADKRKAVLKNNIAFENYVERLRLYDENERMLRELKKLNTKDK
jgi:raffinose/stachyose/melibiose transport system substrate-binding protein